MVKKQAHHLLPLQHVTWRWCFYINLPFGGVAAALIFFLLPARAPIENEYTKGLSFWRRLARLDYGGSGLIIAIISCLLLALQWGGNEYPWGSWRIILLFVLSGVLIAFFCCWIYIMDTKFHRALIPLVVLKNRTLISGSLALAFCMIAFLGAVYQIPLYYEVVGANALALPGEIYGLPLTFVSGAKSQSDKGRYRPIATYDLDRCCTSRHCECTHLLLTRIQVLMRLIGRSVAEDR